MKDTFGSTIDAGENNTPAVGLQAPVRRKAGFLITVLAAASALVVGAAGGATLVSMNAAQVAMAPTEPVAINRMEDWSLVTVKGQVTDIFGNKFILQDQSGRALVETGPAGEDATLVARNEPVTVQGRFERGFIHANYVVHADGKTVALHPAGPPPHWFKRLTDRLAHTAMIQ